MLVWTAIFGAVLGWLGADFEVHGLFVGGAIGWVAGWGVQRTIRAEVKAATSALFAELERRASAVANESSTDAPLSQKERPPNESAYPSQIGEQRIAEMVPEAVPEAVAETTAELDAVLAEQSAPEATLIASVDNSEIDQPARTTSLLSAVFDTARNWLFGGNTIVRIGLVVLFIGLSFLASYAASAGYFPVEMRLALVAMFGAGLLAFGFRTRLQKPNFGLALQGGGVATIYLTLFGAAQLIEGFPLGAAFALMVIVCALGCALALLQRSQAMAVTAFAGGFAVPLLLSTGRGEVAILFGYYTLLSAAILGIARQRSWRVLNVVGFVFTFGVLSLLMLGGYDPKQFLAYQVFLLASVVIYVATAVLYGANTPVKLEGSSPGKVNEKFGGVKFSNAVDATLLFGTALVGFGLEVGLVDDRPFGSAFAALGFAALYIGVAAWISRRYPTTSRIMTEAMLAIGVGFVTLAIPLALTARWTSAAWALEGVGAFWVGMRQARWLPRAFGLVLQGVAALIYFIGMEPNVASLPFANPAFMGAMLIALPILATAWWLRQDLPTSQSRLALVYASVERNLGKAAFLIGFAFWWLAWATETGRTLPALTASGDRVSVFDLDIQMLLAMAAFVISAGGFQILGRRQKWSVAIWPSAMSLAALVIGFLSTLSLNSHILDVPECLIWITIIALHGWMLYLNDHAADGVVSQPLLVATHVGGVWLATAMLVDCMWIGVDKAGLWDTSWAAVVLLASGVAVLFGLTLWATRRMTSGALALGWPLDRHVVAYGWLASLPIVVLVVLGAFLMTLFASGDADPLPYIPLLNPVDLMVALALATIVLWRRAVIASDLAIKGNGLFMGGAGLAVIVLLAFVAINMAWLRAAHQILGVDWASDALFGSFIVQTGLAILWTVLALPLMVIAHRRSDRGLWLAGAGLLGLTVVKLVLVDLNNTNGGARIIAFIAVGALMLVVGYLAPLPPRARATPLQASDETSREGTPV